MYTWELNGKTFHLDKKTHMALCVIYYGAEAGIVITTDALKNSSLDRDAVDVALEIFRSTR